MGAITIPSGTLDGLLGGAAAASGGGLTLLSTTTLSSSSTTISSISGSYKNLRVFISGAYNSSSSNFSMRINGDTGNNYFRELQTMQNGTQANERTNAESAINIGVLDTSTNYNQISQGLLYFPEYTNSLDKYVFVNTVGKGGAAIYQKNGIAGYDTSSAITSLTFFPGDGGTFSGGSILIYGES